MSSLYLSLLFRPLFNQRKKLAYSLGYIVMLGLVLGVLSQNVAVSILGGFEKVFKQAILAFNAQVVLLKNAEMPQSGFEHDLLERQKEQKHITDYSPFIYREALVVHQSQIKGAVVKGLDLQRIESVYGLQVTYQEGFNEKSSGVLLGKAMYEDLKISPEKNEVSVLSPKADLENISSAKNFEKFKVIGFFSSGLFEFDSHFLLLDLNQAQHFYGLENYITGYEIQLPHLDQAESYSSKLSEELNQNKFDAAYKVIPWNVLNADIFESLKLEKVMFFFIMGLMVLIASFNLTGLVTVLGEEQKKEFVILNALGLTKSKLKWLLCFQSLGLAMSGLSLGLLASVGLIYLLQHFNWVLLSQEVYLVSRLPVELSWRYLIFVFLFGFILSAWVSLWASRRQHVA